MATKLSGMTKDILADNLEKMGELFPEAFEEGMVDFDILKQLLGDYVDDSQERYCFSWNGKSRALRLSQTPSKATLRPCKEESKDWDATQNLYIEGDNLEVLKLLQKSYYGRIKMIYIDPPYNTGGDFVYKDNFADNITNYKEQTGQIDGSGNYLTTNVEANGRFHTDWLNMMMPRLRLARNLLTQNGIIVISIDDHEVNNLVKLTDEVFGETNRVAILVWRKKYTGGKGTSTFADYHEYILVYAKDVRNIDEISMARPEEEKGKFTKVDEYVEERGMYYTRPLKSNLDPRPTLVYPIELPNGKTVETQWICAEDTYMQLKEEGRIEFVDSTNSKYPVYKKFYEKDGEGRVKIPSFIEAASNNDAKEELKHLFNIQQTRDLPFQTPKPTGLLRVFIDNLTGKNDIVLDFFAGSSSTAHAIALANLYDNAERRCISVQLPEVCPKGSPAEKIGFKNICEIGKERIRRAGEKIKAEIEEENSQLEIGKEPKQCPDIGFKVFKLDSSNIKEWQPDYDEFERTLTDSLNNFVEGRTEEDVVYEIMLKLGLDLTYPVEETVVNEKKMYSIGFGALMICLDDDITSDIADEMVRQYKDLQPETWKVVFKDIGFKDDSAKTNIKEILKSAGLEEDAFTTI